MRTVVAVHICVKKCIHSDRHFWSKPLSLRVYESPEPANSGSPTNPQSRCCCHWPPRRERPYHARVCDQNWEGTQMEAKPASLLVSAVAVMTVRGMGAVNVEN